MIISRLCSLCLRRTKHVSSFTPVFRRNFRPPETSKLKPRRDGFRVTLREGFKGEEEFGESVAWRDLQQNRTKYICILGGSTLGLLGLGLVWEYYVPHIPWHAGIPEWHDREEWLENCDLEPFDDEVEISYLFGERMSKTLLLVPWNGLSRLWGKLNLKTIPESLRRPILGLYAWMYNVNLDEAVDPDLKHYNNLSEFFRRAIKPEVRPIDTTFELVSPADGKIVVCGAVRKGQLQQIKGCTYPVSDFLGPGFKPPPPNRAYYYCVIYLAPGDYHGFHSPADWTVSVRRHFTGRLLSVGKWATFRIRQVHCLNERVALLGRWKHGFFSMTAVGATNVGNIKITNEPEFETNLKKAVNTLDDKVISDWKVTPGEKVGEFQLGSSIVLVFEAPKTFKFTKLPEDTVKFGQALGKFRH